MLYHLSSHSSEGPGRCLTSPLTLICWRNSEEGGKRWQEGHSQGREPVTGQEGWKDLSRWGKRREARFGADLTDRPEPELALRSHGSFWAGQWQARGRVTEGQPCSECTMVQNGTPWRCRELKLLLQLGHKRTVEASTGTIHSFNAYWLCAYYVPGTSRH